MGLDVSRGTPVPPTHVESYRGYLHQLPSSEETSMVITLLRALNGRSHTSVIHSTEQTSLDELLENHLPARCRLVVSASQVTDTHQFCYRKLMLNNEYALLAPFYNHRMQEKRQRKAATRTSPGDRLAMGPVDGCTRTVVHITKERMNSGNG
ncbi:unnamed protein product [Heligmosomoides polygyrus]|uniref:DNA helicase n=1 Tax=Heligmosomoides polygyrus TaxID=6339 RepID=A0A183FYF6_HELPZ|nr:unnamed protein product [Heligmosomoides polygyrus]